MKNNRMTRLLALVLMLAMMVGAFAGCGGKAGDKSGGSKKTDEELIVGKWQTDLDFQKLADSMAAEGEEMMGDIDLSGVSMKLGIEFKADGTYAVEMDQASAESAMKQLVEKMIPMIKEEIKQQMGGMEVTDEMMDSMLAMFGVDSWDALGEMFLQELDLSEANVSGKYLLKDGKLHMSTSADGDPAAEEGGAYTVSEKTLTLTLPGEEMAALKELTFNRVG